MQDYGNFVLYDSTGTRVLWQTFEHPTNTLLAGQSLKPGQTLFSSVLETDQSIGVFRLDRLDMQFDGNLVLYQNGGTATDQAYWDTKTFTSGATLNLDYNGNLYLLHKSTSFTKNLTQGGYPTKDALYLMKFEAGGIFRLHYQDLSNTSKNGPITWASSSNMCIGKGLCGNNGYCVARNHNARCRCIPGFEFVNRKRRSSGSRRTYTAESCRILDVQTAIQMTNLNNSQWEDTPYNITEAPTQEECSSACLHDCNCMAALYTGQE
ncbi:putative non-specific serine/threonine protein kinase [Helianthus debilis subsp. tardiflorus]